MYLSPQEKKLALDRLPPKKSDAHNIEFRSLAKRILKSPTMCASFQVHVAQKLIIPQLHPHILLCRQRYARSLRFPGP
jgi:hypothetical protein